MSSNDQIKFAAECIRAGKLVAFPTETVYGLGANALDAMAVAKIFSIKERPSFDPLIVHVSDMDMILKLTIAYHDKVSLIADHFWPGPLTVILPKSVLVPDIVTAGMDTVGIRIPNHPVALSLIRESGCPIAAPSANKFGRVSPTEVRHVLKQLSNVECVLDGGRTSVGIESTIITLHEDGFEILRSGFITKEELLKVLPLSREDSKENILAPGMIKSHYSPSKPLYLDDGSRQLDIDRVGYIAFSRDPGIKYGRISYLSKSGNLKEAAVNLFATIHEMEDADIDYILVEKLPEEGVGIAVMDRLRKAEYKFL